MSPEDLLPPAPFQPDLARPRVAATLQAALEKPLLALIAPGGFGKTCALRSFWEATLPPRAWLDAATLPAQRFSSVLDSALAGFAERGLLVIDSIEHLDAATTEALARTLERAPRGLRIILSGRTHHGLPLPLWRSQGRLASLNAHHLALSSEEWRAAGLDGDAQDWVGWWGARQASAQPEARWDPELAEWLDLAWLSALDTASVADLGRAALLTEAKLECLMALGVGSPAQAEKTRLNVATLAGPLCQPGGGVQLAARFRPYLVAAWRARDPQGWLQAICTGTATLLARGEPELAASVALETGDAELGKAQARRVLQAAGWTLLFNRHRPLLRSLLDATVEDAGQALHDLLTAGWKTEVEKRPHEAEETLERLVEATDPVIAGQARALRASMAHQYDGFACARSHAALAMQALTDNDPAFVLAELVDACAALADGEIDEADAALTHVLACASRDGLDHLQIDALHRRAIAAFERGQPEIARQSIAERRKRARLAGLETPITLDSSARLDALLHLQHLDTAAALRALATGQGAYALLGDYWNFPYISLQATAHLIDGNIAEARLELAELETQLAERFYCQKWRADVLLPRIWLRAIDADRDGLSTLATRVQAETWPPSLYRDRRDLYCTGARLLAGDPIDTQALGDFAAQREAQGAIDIAAFARRLLALANNDRDALLREVQYCAALGDRLDWLWLAPRALGPLEALLSHPTLANDAATRTYLRELVQRLLAPSIQPHDTHDTTAEPEPPAGLTTKEWKILRLIGAQLTNEQIAAQLFVSLATVKTHINHLYAKLDIRTRAEAIHRARTLGQG